MEEYWVSARILSHLLVWTEGQGYDRSELARRAGLSLPIPTSPHARVNVETQFKLWRLCANKEPPGFAMEAGSRMAVHALPTVGPLIAVNGTVRGALQSLVKGAPLLTNAVVVTYEETPRVGGIYQKLLLRHHPIEAFESALAHWFAMVRLVSGRDITPVEVALPCAKARDRAHASFFGTSIRYRAERAGLIYDSADLDISLPGVDSDAQFALERLLEQRVQRELGPMTMRCRLRLLAQSADASASLDATARALGMSTRTLQRSLSDEGIRFREILDSVLAERAMRLLRRPETSIDEIAGTLGYERRSFYRAFTRWTGEPPARWRRLNAG